LGNLGVSYNQLGDGRGGIGYFSRIWTTRDLGDRHGEGTALGNLGVLIIKWAMRVWRLVIMSSIGPRELGDRHGEGQALGNRAYLQLGDVRRAIGFMSSIWHCANRRPSWRRSGVDNLGITYFQLGDARGAIDYYKQC
jgi:hypothetical protein